MLMIDERPDKWVVRQILDDPAGDRDWAVNAEISLSDSDELGAAAVQVLSVAPASSGT
jgi:hypothetical protein